MSGVSPAHLRSASGVFQTVPGISGASPCDATFQTTGGIQSLAAGVGAWILPAGVVPNYEIMVTATAGAFSTGTVGTWLDFSINRTWTKSAGTVTYTVSFREKGSGIVRNTQTGRTLQGL